MEPIISTSTIAEEIQLSVAPVFLLTAIGGLLNVLASRLSRAMDRIDADENGSPAVRARGYAADCLHYLVEPSLRRDRHFGVSGRGVHIYGRLCSGKHVWRDRIFLCPGDGLTDGRTHLVPFGTHGCK